MRGALRGVMVLAFMIFSGSTGMAKPILDVHSHPIFRDYVEDVSRHGAALSETFPLPGYEVEKHLASMDKAGIATSILSMPPPNPYFGDAASARKASRDFNTHCFELKRRHPGRFMYCASLPLPDVQGAIEEAVFALDNLEADCVKIATNSSGLYLGDESLDTLMEELDRRKVVIITHPQRPEPVNDSIIHNAPLPVNEYLAETTRAIINMLSRNVLAKYPDVKVIVPHCGAYLPLAIPRVKALLPAMEKNGLMKAIDWNANLNGLYFDLAGAPSAEAVRQLLKITDASHILFGSDYPYQPDDVLMRNLEFLEEDLAKDPRLSQMANAILYENAIELFDLNKKESVSVNL